MLSPTETCIVHWQRGGVLGENVIPGLRKKDRLFLSAEYEQISILWNERRGIMLWKRLVIVVLVVCMVGVCGITVSPMESCQAAATPTWVSYAPSGLGIQYWVTSARSDGTFTVDERNLCFNHKFTGRVYLVTDKNGKVTDVRVSVDNMTRLFWDQVDNEEKNQQIDQYWKLLGVAVVDVAGALASGGTAVITLPLEKELSWGGDYVAKKIAACYESADVTVPWGMLKAFEIDVCLKAAAAIYKRYGGRYLKKVAG